MSDELTYPNSLEAVASQPIERKIYSIRRMQVILDVDIALLYGVSTKRLNQQVQRNITRFPLDFMFQLSVEEFEYLRLQNVTAKWSKRRSLPYAFTELGISMLSSILTTETAVQANVQIMRAFAAMRQFLASNAPVFQRLENLENKLMLTDQKVEKLYSKLEEGKLEPRQGIFLMVRSLTLILSSPA